MTNPVQAATIIQRRSACPDHSVALRASAGSGKTKVLVDRFLRLCIETGAHPRSILAVTFTRKAAVEIQERLMGRARRMALASYAELTQELSALFEGREKGAPTAVEKNAAANLLEKILEDVSGLNVGTIHAFCQLILGRFAAEAGLDPHFSVLENQDDLIDEALEALEREMAADPVLRAAAATVGPKPSSVRVTLRGIFPEQMRLGRWLAAHPEAACRSDKLPDLLDDLKAFLFPDLQLSGDPEAADFLPLLAAELEAFAGPGADAIAAELGADLDTVKPANLEKLRLKAAQVAEGLRAEGASDAKGPGDSSDGLVAEARKIFLTAANKTRSFTAIRKDIELKERFNALVSTQALGVLGVLHRLGYIELYRQNQARLQLALRLLDIYDGLKKRDRVVDFQDLEDMACRLMGDEGSVGALLFRLDDSLSHILLDEFQDTNFNQWDMLKPFVDEFLSTTNDGRARTLFFVGDVKQSIYGFRGAEPSIFTGACELLQKHDLNVESLPTNFRSLQHVVDGVGCLFRADPLKHSLSAAERENVHQRWARGEAEGQVLFLEPFAAAQADDSDPAADVDERSGDQLAAQATAQLVRQMKEDPAGITWDGFGEQLKERPLQWSDFLILSRTRTEISLYEKAFRDENIPFVPPGRGMLAASREVQDILALLRWLLWPDDDAALASVLRSPIFRLQDKPFQELLAARELLKPGDEEGRFRTPSNLWPALKKKADEEPYWRPVRLLKEWRKHLGFDTCHDLLRRIFREGQVLERYQVARGDQARFNLLRLFDLALSPEISGTPTVRQLADFIGTAAGRGGQEEGALPRDGGEGRVQFMTVHGAKGLEAPVVFLVDANRPSGKESPRVRMRAESPDTPLLFKVNKAHRDGFQLPESVAWPQDPLQVASAEARERDLAEEANLLYVAMTRARDRLVVVGSQRDRGEENDSPMRKIGTALLADDCGKHVQTDDPVGFLRPPDAATPKVASVPSIVAARVRSWQPPPPRETMKVITPSGVHDDSNDDSAPLTAGPRVQQDESDPTERGHEVHLKLQLAADHGAMPPGGGPNHDEAAAVFADDHLAWVFRPQDEGGQGLSEVPVIHRRVPGAGTIEERITGIIDRLVVRPERIDIIDYKTNRFGGDQKVRSNLVNHYRPQLATYAEVMAQLYPDRTIHTWLLFTEPGLSGDQRLEEVTVS